MIFLMVWTYPKAWPNGRLHHTTLEVDTDAHAEVQTEFEKS
jgi:hypothetical protein